MKKNTHTHNTQANERNAWNKWNDGMNGMDGMVGMEPKGWRKDIEKTKKMGFKNPIITWRVEYSAPFTAAAPFFSTFW